MLEQQDREWLTATMENASMKGAKEALTEHQDLVHGPLNKEINRIDRKAGTTLKTIMIIASGAAIIGALVGFAGG